jgi:PQQ-dependent catabolism-associated beta-propeller protein
MRRDRAGMVLALLAAFGGARAETVYVTDEKANVVHVVVAPHWDQVASIPVGRRPRGIALAPGGRELFVAASNDDRIEVIDLATRRVVRHIESGPDPERFAIAPDGRTLYVANEDDAKVSFYALPEGRLLREVEVGPEPEGIAISPDGRLLVCTSEAASLVHFIDAGDGRVLDTVMVGTRPRDAVFSADGSRLWVSSEARASVAMFALPRRELLRTLDFEAQSGAPPSVQAVGMVLARDAAFVALGRGNHVAEVDPGSLQVRRFLPVGSRNWSVARSPDGRRLYAANGLSGDVTVIDLRRGVTEATLRTGGKPWGVVVAQ